MFKKNKVSAAVGFFFFLSHTIVFCFILTWNAHELVWTVTVVSSPPPGGYVQSASLVFHSESTWPDPVSVTPGDAECLLTPGTAPQSLVRVFFSHKPTQLKSIITRFLRGVVTLALCCLDPGLDIITGLLPPVCGIC